MMMPALAGVLFLLAGAYFMVSVYRRSSLRLDLSEDDVAAVDGVITEKLVGQQRDRFIPISVEQYTLRYAFANLEGKMRSGEQEVTRAFFEAAPEPGRPTTVYLSTTDPTQHAVDISPAFPGISGLRLAVGAVLLLAGCGCVGFAAHELRALNSP